MLARLDLHYARDLLFHFPRAYQDMSELKDIDQLEEGKLASVCGVVEEVDLRNTGVGKSLLGVLIRQETKYLRLLYFNQPWRRQTFNPGQRVLVSGEPKLQGLRWEMSHPTVEFLAPVRAGDYLEIEGEIVSTGTTSRKMRFEARKMIELARDGSLAPSAANVLDPPIVVCRATGTCVVPKDLQRKR